MTQTFLKIKSSKFLLKRTSLVFILKLYDLKKILCPGEGFVKVGFIFEGPYHLGADDGRCNLKGEKS